MIMGMGRMINKEKLKCLDKTYFSAILPITNPTWTGMWDLWWMK